MFWRRLQEKMESWGCDVNVNVSPSDVVANKSTGELTPICVYAQGKKNINTECNFGMKIFLYFNVAYISVIAFMLPITPRFVSFLGKKHVKRGKNSISHIKRWINWVLVAFPFTAFPLVLWEEKCRMGIKGREDERGMEKGDGGREKWDERLMEGGRRSEEEEPQQTHMTCSHSLQPVMSFLMTLMRTDWFITQVHARGHARTHTLINNNTASYFTSSLWEDWTRDTLDDWYLHVWSCNGRQICRPS